MCSQNAANAISGIQILKLFGSVQMFTVVTCGKNLLFKILSTFNKQDAYYYK
jgi:hypothetical protein